MTIEEIEAYNREQVKKLRDWCKGKPITVSQADSDEEEQNND